MKRPAIAAAIILSTTSAHADRFTYTCRIKGKSLLMKVDDARHTLQWRGKVYKIKDAEGCARTGWRAEGNGEAFNFCVATQGYADFEEKGQQVQCDQNR